jgi:hypothetical protein
MHDRRRCLPEPTPICTPMRPDRAFIDSDQFSLENCIPICATGFLKHNGNMAYVVLPILRSQEVSRP